MKKILYIIPIFILIFTLKTDVFGATNTFLNSPEIDLSSKITLPAGVTWSNSNIWYCISVVNSGGTNYYCLNLFACPINNKVWINSADSYKVYGTGIKRYKTYNVGSSYVWGASDLNNLNYNLTESHTDVYTYSSGYSDSVYNSYQVGSNCTLYGNSAYSLIAMNSSYPPTVLKKSLTVSGSYPTDMKSVTVYADIINKETTDKIYYTLDNENWIQYINVLTFDKNQNVTFKAVNGSSSVFDLITYKITDIVQLDNSSMNYDVSYLMKDFKAYFTPTVTGVSSYVAGVRVKVIDGATNVVETGYNDFVNKTINQQFYLTGKKDTTFTVLFEFYNTTTNEVLKDKTVTVYVKDGTGIVIEDTGSSSTTSNYSNLDPNDPIGSMNNFLNQSNNFFDLIKVIFSSFPAWITAPIALLILGTIIIALFKAFRG